LLNILRFFHLIFINRFSFLNCIHIINKIAIDLILFIVRLIKIYLWYFVLAFSFLWWNLCSFLQVNELKILNSFLIIIQLLYLYIIFILLIVLFILQIIILLQLYFLTGILIIILLIMKWAFLSIIKSNRFYFLKIEILFCPTLIIKIFLIKWLQVLLALCSYNVWTSSLRWCPRNHQIRPNIDNIFLSCRYDLVLEYLLLIIVLISLPLLLI
jgi:hypothetical protein